MTGIGELNLGTSSAVFEGEGSVGANGEGSGEGDIELVGDTIALSLGVGISDALGTELELGETDTLGMVGTEDMLSLGVADAKGGLTPVSGDGIPPTSMSPNRPALIRFGIRPDRKLYGNWSVAFLSKHWKRAVHIPGRITAVLHFPSGCVLNFSLTPDS